MAAQAFADKINRVPPSIITQAPAPVADVAKDEAPVAEALKQLDQLIATGHGELLNLMNTLEPYLPRFLFEENNDKAEADTSVYRPTVGSTLSPTQVALNISLDNLERLIDRIKYLRNQVIL
jgi:hypothetical protein